MWVYDLFFWIKEWWFLIVLVGGGIISFKKGIDSINSNIKDVIQQLKSFNEKIMLSEKDREKIHAELAMHDARLDEHDKKMVAHDERLRTLLNERK